MDQLVARVARRYVTPRGRAFSRLVPPRVHVAVDPPTEILKHLPPDLLGSYERGMELHAAVRGRHAGTWLVQVLPGEDRGRLIAELVSALGSGAALVLVPEVRYGSVVLEGIEAHLPHIVRVDSARPAGERSSAWLAMAAGHRLAGGGRAAVFTPAPDLALIVVDEEHDPTYKEDRSPRYDTRWVALQRAELQGALCVFLSSSPSVETAARAHSGTFSSVVPRRSARRAARPIVELVARPEDRSVGSDLHDRMRQVLRARQRVALLAPSAAFARAVWCGDCRRSLRCPECEAGLFYDRAERRVRCARCRYAAPAPATCPTCGASEFKLVGAGTERLVEQLRKAFPRTRVVRVDPEHPALVPDSDIYVTTWIGTKPELRPDVTLVGVLDADWLIRRPEFRAAENAYQAIVEMAEWAGPATRGGRLVIQTAEPTHHSLQAVVRADAEFFLRKELELRRELSYPPFVELVKVEVTELDARARAEVIKQVVGKVSTRVLGPVHAARSGSGDGFELLIKCRDAGPVADELRVILETTSKGTARVSIDVDPR